MKFAKWVCLAISRLDFEGSPQNRFFFGPCFFFAAVNRAETLNVA